MRKNEKSILSLGPNGPILQNFLVGSLKMPSDGSNNLIFLDQVKRHCVVCTNYRVCNYTSTGSIQNTVSTRGNITLNWLYNAVVKLIREIVFSLQIGSIDWLWASG